MKTQVKGFSPHQPHYEEEVSSLRLAEARRRLSAGSLLREHFSPDDQLTDTLLRRQWQQAEVLAVQTHVQQVLLREMVGNQVGLRAERHKMM